MNLCRTVERVLDSTNTGCQVLSRDQDTVIVYNCASITQSHINALIALHPHVSYDLQACESSLSGFIVIFSDSPTRRLVHSSEFFTIMTSCLIAAASMSLVL